MSVKSIIRISLTSMLAAALIINLGSCRKKLKGENLLYEGTWTNGELYDEFSSSDYDPVNNTYIETYTKEWYSGGKTITIEASGRAYYSAHASSGFTTTSKEINGKAKIKKNKLTIKFSVIKEEFTINQSPTEDKYGRYMVLSGDTFRID